MESYSLFIAAAAADFIRFVKLLIKMYQAGSTPKILNGFVCSRQRSVSINFLKWADGRRNGDQKQCFVFCSSPPSASGDWPALAANYTMSPTMLKLEKLAIVCLRPIPNF